MGLFMWFKCDRMQRSTKTTTTGSCVALDVTQTLLECDHLTALGSARAQQTAALTNRLQPSNLKSLPQFSAPVKTPALMMDVASLCEPMVG